MKRWLVAVVFAGLCLHGPLGSAQTSLGVGVYAPEIPLNPYQWFSYAQSLAGHLSKALGVPVQGFAYKSSGDFNRDLKARRIQFAVLGGFHQAAGRRGRVLASAKLASSRQLLWSLMCKGRTDLAALRGKVLQLPNLGGLINGLVQNGLFGGNVTITKHFKIVRSPSLTSAAEAVRLGQAQAVFAPVNTSGLVPILRRTIGVPPPAFVLVDASQHEARVKKVIGAIQSFGGKTRVLVGWGAADAKQYARFAALARRRPLRMQMTPTGALRFRHSDIINATTLQLELPSTERLFEVP